MALGLNYSSGGGDFLPILKYDARAGRFFRVDRADGVSTPVDVTRNLKMVVDFENLEIGWIHFAAGAAPSFTMAPFGAPLPAKPSPDHKQGLRVCVKLSAECGGDVRELASAAGAFLRGMDDLHTAYEAGKTANPGKLPVVVLSDTLPLESGAGAKKSTNYQPVFAIAAWVARPKDLGPNPRSNGEAPPAAPAPAARPPATGSTQVAPPAARAPAMAAAEEDFG